MHFLWNCPQVIDILNRRTKDFAIIKPNFIQWVIRPLSGTFCLKKFVGKIINSLNSSPPSVPYMCQWTGSTLVQVMACRRTRLSPVWRQAINRTNAGLLSIGPWGTNFNEILIEIHTFSFKKMRLKMSSAKLVAILSWGDELMGSMTANFCQSSAPTTTHCIQHRTQLTAEPGTLGPFCRWRGSCSGWFLSSLQHFHLRWIHEHFLLQCPSG